MGNVKINFTAIDSFRQHEPHYSRLSPEIQSRAVFLLILAMIKVILLPTISKGNENK